MRTWGATRFGWGFGSRDSMMGYVPLQGDEDPRMESVTWGCCKMAAVSEFRGWPSPDTKLVGNLILNFSTSRNVRNKYLLFKALHLWNFVIAPWTKTVSTSIMIVSFSHLFFRYMTDPKRPTKRKKKKQNPQLRLGLWMAWLGIGWSAEHQI